MSNEHEYSSLEKINQKKVENALFSIPNLLSIKNSYKKIQFVSFLAEWCPNCDYEAIELANYVDTYNSLVEFSIVMQFTTHAKSGKFISKYRLNTSLIQPECKQKDEELNIKRFTFPSTAAFNKFKVPVTFVSLNEIGSSIDG